MAARRRGAQVMLIALALTVPMVHPEARLGGRATETSDEAHTPEPGTGPIDRLAWPLVHIPDPAARRLLTDALDAACARLEAPACARILTDFAAVTLSLTDRLDALQTDIHRYPAMVVFLDESRHPLCLGGSLAFTTPGSRVVRVCRNELIRQSLNRDYIVAMVIHEVLHTLGLPENPPSSREITRQVLARCGKTK